MSPGGGNYACAEALRGKSGVSGVQALFCEGENKAFRVYKHCFARENTLFRGCRIWVAKKNSMRINYQVTFNKKKAK